MAIPPSNSLHNWSTAEVTSIFFNASALCPLGKIQPIPSCFPPLCLSNGHPSTGASPIPTFEHRPSLYLSIAHPTIRESPILQFTIRASPILQFDHRPPLYFNGHDSANTGTHCPTLYRSWTLPYLRAHRSSIYVALRALRRQGNILCGILSLPD
jgi:hypothetical protein